jgi:hypothetical protein
MATLAPQRSALSADERFYFLLSVLMALVLVAGFSFHLSMGRSSFAAPLLWHLHGVVFFGWVALFVTQSWLASRGPIALHRRLGWLAAIWLPLMLGLGTAITIATVRRGTTPFFFQPQQFLISNPLGLVCFAGLVIAAIRLRRSPDWHRRLQIGAFAALLGPGFGRLLPSPFLVPYAFEIAVAAGLLFPLAAMIRERRREGRIHPAWWWSVGSVVATVALAGLIAPTPLGDALYAFATAGSAGASIPGLAFGQMPAL